MKKVVKLTRAQLRSIVNEVSNASRIDETIEHDPDGVLMEASDRIGTFWKETFNEGDPIQADLGRSAWDEQVDQAVEELFDQFKAALDEVDTKLLNGEYHIRSRLRRQHYDG